MISNLRYKRLLESFYKCPIFYNRVRFLLWKEEIVVIGVIEMTANGTVCLG